MPTDHPSTGTETHEGDRLLQHLRRAAATVLTYWNGEAERLYGWSAAEAIGQPVQTLTVGLADEQLGRRIMRSICWTGHWEGDFWVRRKDRSTFRACVVHILIEDDEGIPLAIFGVSRDTEHEPGA